MKPIFLIGYMGSGKSTLGRVLSEMLECEFTDLDAYIENRYHKTVKQIFAEHGEAEDASRGVRVSRHRDSLWRRHAMFRRQYGFDEQPWGGGLSAGACGETVSALVASAVEG